MERVYRKDKIEVLEGIKEEVVPAHKKKELQSTPETIRAAITYSSEHKNYAIICVLHNVISSRKYSRKY